MRGKIFRNSTYLLLGQGVVKVISFFYTIFLARSLGVESFGLYTVALAYFSLVSSVADLGFNRFLVREGSRDISRLKKYLCDTVLLRFFLTSIAFAIFALWLYFFDKDSMRVSLSLLAVLAVLPQSIALTLDAFFVVKQKLQFSALGTLILSLSTAILGVFFIQKGFGVFGAVEGLIFGEVIYVVGLGALVYLQVRQKNLRHVIATLCSVKLGDLKEVARGSIPYGILGILGLLYFKVDTILLSYMKGAVDTGYYGAAYKFLEALIFVPSAIATAMFPVVAKLHDSDLKKVKKLYYQSLMFLGGLSLVLMSVYLFILPLIIKMYLPGYMQSIEAIKILSYTIPFMFIHTPGALILISSEKYLRPVILLSIGMLAFNVILNLVLIPEFGYIGASWVTVASEALSFVVFFVLLQRKVFKDV